MCLIAVAHAVSSEFPFILAPNRDERHARASEALGWWPDAAGVLGGRDRVAGGSWLAASTRGRIAAVANVRTGVGGAGSRSRGALVSQFLSAPHGAATFIERTLEIRGDYGPFHLLLYDGSGLYYLGHRGDPEALDAGSFAFSNAELGDAWPKTLRARDCIASVATTASGGDVESALLEFLDDRREGESRDASGVQAVDYRERVFIPGAAFGTRCSSVVTVSAARELAFTERRFDAAGQCTGQSRMTAQIER